MSENKQIVKNKSKAYGYNYASLADIVNQGFTLPKMTTKMVEGEMFVFWYDESMKEWLQGAPVIVPEMKGMNAAQAMGSALTYSRRYTAQMALGLACDDDSKLEKTEGAPEATGRVYRNKGIDFDEVRVRLATSSTIDELEEYWSTLKPSSEKQAAALKAMFSKRKAEL